MSMLSDAPSPLSSSLSSPVVQTPNSTPKRHDAFFYFQDVVFQVEDTLFNVQRYGQTMDHAFDSFFKSSIEGSSTGASDEDPIVLEDVTVKEFRLLLTMLFPPSGVDNEINTGIFTLDNWISILRLSSAWNLSTVRRAAIARAEPKVNALPIVDKILLADRFDIDSWLNEAYDALIVRQESITPQERDKLGWETYGRLMELREQCWVVRTQQMQISPALATGKSTSMKKKKKSGKR